MILKLIQLIINSLNFKVVLELLINIVMLLILVFGEALALYGLIIGLILCFKSVDM